MSTPTKKDSPRTCKPCEGGVAPMSAGEIRERLKKIEGWTFVDGAIRRSFDFKNYDETLAFVNAVARIAIRENHHPHISFGYRQCVVSYSTHSIGGISENDFVCAALINAI